MLLAAKLYAAKEDCMHRLFFQLTCAVPMTWVVTREPMTRVVTYSIGCHEPTDDIADTLCS